MIDPQVRSVDVDGHRLVYHVIDGGKDGYVLWCQEINQHLDLALTDPTIAETISALSRQGLTSIMVQQRGLGISDPVPRRPTVAEQASDLVAILDAESVTQATLFSIYSMNMAAALVAAQHPERVGGLVMVSPFLVAPGVSDTEHGWTAEQAAVVVERYRRAVDEWGTGASLRLWDPNLCTPHNTRLVAMLERCTASPETARAFLEQMLNADGRAIFPEVRVPTRVLRVPGNLLPERVVRAVADAIEGAEYHSLPPTELGDSIGLAWTPMTQHVAEMARVAAAGTGKPDRVLASVLFVDIVGSTDELARRGDTEWAQLLDRFERLTRREVAKADGRYVKSTGDGALCEFASPAGAVESAQALCAGTSELEIEIRAGVHTGECERRGEDLAGLALHIGARVCAAAGPGEVAVSRTVRDLLVGSDLRFASRGEHELKGVPGRWEIFAAGTETATAAAPATPQPRPLDRMVVGLARRSPRTLRAANRVANAVQRRRATR
jgi:class 3 adenylate cyclase/pimeloyl-ACP methyl ester carboxylesterase